MDADFAEKYRHRELREYKFFRHGLTQSVREIGIPGYQVAGYQGSRISGD